MLFRVLLFSMCLFSGGHLAAEVQLPKIFASHMVLQRDKPIPVWGWAGTGEKVTVLLKGATIKGQEKTTKAGTDGKWMIYLDVEKAGGPYLLVVKGKNNTVILDDVLIGEVWICSGQSNMDFLVETSDNAQKEIAAAHYPQIRHFKVAWNKSLTPEDDLLGESWEVTTPENVGKFTAIGFYFARNLYEKLGVPIGLINSSWGGTMVETWMSKEALLSFNEFSDAVKSMPASMHALGDKRRTKLANAINNLQGGLPSAAEVQSWSAVSFDDSNWETIGLPDYFDRRALGYLDGAVWFRREFILPDSLSGMSMVLSLGTIDDIDATYVNGVKVGSTSAKTSTGRTYILDPPQLRAGKNTIAVRIEDLGDRGGFTGKPSDMKISRDAYEQPLSGTWKFRIETSVDNNQFVGPNETGALLYNAMIAPLIPYAIRGVIWYQGEYNAGRAYQYRKSFPLLISDWRSHWKEEFPFLFVQLASYNDNNGNSNKGSAWAELREAQSLTLQTVPLTGMAVTHDIGNPVNIHPANKQDVGKRLALNALRIAYGQDVICSGPQYESMQREGSKIVLSFSNTGGGLTAHDKYGYLHGFEIAGADKKFYWARAEIRHNKVIVWSDNVTEPVAVHYGWADDNIEANLFNKEGLPAAPFRTDTWKGITEEEGFK
ncbi:MAG: sialate O-acetylesterase [Chitinophagaceae bacterium]|nr:sialate O-acetylesterase [Chitinophagaceae bacterium]